MKESGIEKLVKLLNEYHFFNTEYVGYYLDKEENRIYFKTEVVDKGLINEQRISDEWLISKKFGFIQWLVENDKIDFELPIETLSFREYYDIKKSDFLIALLSIQDNPIEFLISILK